MADMKEQDLEAGSSHTSENDDEDALRTTSGNAVHIKGPVSLSTTPLPVCCCGFPKTGGYIGKAVWICGPDGATIFPLK